MGTAKKLRSNKGFTLVELVVVIAVLAILAGVGTAAYGGYIQRANKAADEILLETVQTAAFSALAKYGAVTEIKVSPDGQTVTAKIGGDNYTLKAASVAEDMKAVANEFAVLTAGNELSFNSKDYKDTGATWKTNVGWAPTTGA